MCVDGDWLVVLVCMVGSSCVGWDEEGSVSEDGEGGGLYRGGVCGGSRYSSTSPPGDTLSLIHSGDVVGWRCCA
jgi:hypothetical protein